MNNDQQKNNIIDKVLKRIKSGEVKMKPKAYFVLRMISLALGTLFLALFIIYLISFIIFSLRASGVMFLPRFGFPGLGFLFNSLPWLLILIAAILIILLEIFAKKFNFVHRRPILYSLLAIIIIVFAGSFLIDKTPFHPTLFWRAQEGRLPAMGTVYRDFGAPKIENVHHGVVYEVTENGFLIETPRNETLTITITPESKFLPKTDIKEGDTVVVLGEKSDSTVEALGVRKVEEDINLFPQQRMRHLRPPFRR